MGAAGRVQALVRYPVKSMLGEELDRVEVGVDGLAGDRGWGVVDHSTGHLASAKHPRRFGALLTCRATLPPGEDEPTVVVPGHDGVSASDTAAAERLSALLGRPVHLAPASRCPRVIARTDPPGDGAAYDGGPLGPATSGTVARGVDGEDRLVDFAPVHLLARATVEALARVVGDPATSWRRFRPNLVLDLDVPPFSESDWTGHLVRVGGVELTVVTPTPRCVVPTLGQDGLAASPHTLRALAARNRVEVLDRGPRTCLGAYATVTHPGTIRQGDPVVLS